ncbi:MAG: acetylxylan esterase [Kiritimatiellia bacterium]
MKRTLTAMAVFAAALAVAAEKVSFKIETNRPDCVYRCGEEVAFTVTVTGETGTPVTAGRLKATLDNFGNRKISERTIDLAAENPFTLRARTDVPGFLRLQFACPSRELVFAPNRGQGAPYTWGVACEPEKIRPGAPDPDDFDAFWADAVKQLDATTPVDAQLEEIPAKSNRERTYYRVSFASAGGRRVWGWLSLPKGPGPFPVDVSVPGAGIGALGTGGDGRRISLTMNVHSYPQPDTDEARKAAYQAQDLKYAAPCGVARYCQAGIHESREAYFYYASLLGINRAVNWLWARPEVDRTRFTYTGTSQGGGFGLMLTALNGHFTKSCVFVPAITDLLGFRQDDRQSGWPRLVEAQRAENRAAAEKWAPYFDGANFAARITCPIRVVAGFADCVCTPCGVYAAYNRIPARDKKILHGIGMGHGVSGEFYRELEAWRKAPRTPPAGEVRLGPHASRRGDLVTVDIPAGAPQSGQATLPLDLTPFEGKPFVATIRARGFGLSKPPEDWLGFKFMVSYKDARTGLPHWPGAAQKAGDFDWQTVRLVDNQTDVSRRQGTLTLGIQAGTGKVEFDLSTLDVRELPPLWPATNATHRCVYTPDVASLPPRRGVMLGHRLKEDDIRVLRDWGATLARFQMSHQWNTVGGNRDLAAYDRYIDGELDDLEKILGWAKTYGLQIVVDLHAAPGARDADKDLFMCHDRKYADHFVATWRRIATRFANRPEIYGFDLINEPQQTKPALPGCDYWSLQARAAEAIRAIDPKTPIVVESNCYDAPAAFAYLRPLALTNVIYQVHMYLPAEFTHQQVFNRNAPRTVYPDPARKWDIGYLRNALKPVVAFQKRHHAKIYVGEFSAIVWGQGADAYIRDCIALFEENRWDWTFHAYREWSGWSVEHEAAEPWQQVPSQDNPRKRALLEGFRR